MFQLTVPVVHAESVGWQDRLLVLEVPQMASVARPGQFVMVRCRDLPLRRPVSIHAASEDKLALLFRIAGTGTRWLSGIEPGSCVNLTGPLGNGYSMGSDEGRMVLIAGGMGIAPLFFLAERLAAAHRVVLVHGSRCKDELYQAPDRLRELIPEVRALDAVDWLFATDDGSAGVCGSALEVALPYVEDAAQVYMCGPVAMCVAAHEFTGDSSDVIGGIRDAACTPQARERLNCAEVSLEVRMGCGVGACYSCSIPTRHGRRKVCKDGPVFRLDDVQWEGVCT